MSEPFSLLPEPRGHPVAGAPSLGGAYTCTISM